MLECKTVYVQRDETKQTSVYTIEVDKGNDLVDLSGVLERIPDHQDKYFQIYSPSHDAYIPLCFVSEGKYAILREYGLLGVIMIKYSDEPEKPEQEVPSEDSKKQRSKERNIREVIEMVHKWRELHETTTEGKRINLQEAAKIVGISKKSLDDYFFQLRMGERYGFDFAGNMNNKIGMLRSFVKEHELEAKKTGKQHNTARHPRKLKIIEQFAQKLSLKDSPSCFEVSTSKEQESEDSDDLPKPLNNQDNRFNFKQQQHVFWGSPFSPIDQRAFLDCQEVFYQDIQNLMGEASDPFIPFSTFKKTKSIFGQQQPCSPSSFGF